MLYLTNIQQLYEEKAEALPNALHEALGPYVVKGQPLTRADLWGILASHPDLMVLNDEAHHVHSDDLEWAKAIKRQSRGGSAHSQGFHLPGKTYES